MRRIATVLALSLSMLGSACIVVPANNAAPPPPPPPPPVDAYQQPPPPPPPPAPTPYGEYQQPGYGTTTTTTTVVYYNEAPPQPVAYYEPNQVWYYGPHPVTPGYGYGWCPMQGPHTHNYDPYWNDRYEFYSGYYYYLGDPYAYDQTVVFYIYVDPHPNPWGGWCYAHGEHHHYYAPRQNENYRYNGNRFVYAGAYDHVYYEHQNDYDQSGHRRGGNRYADHEQYRVQHPGTSASHEGPNGHGNGAFENRRDDRGPGGQPIQAGHGEAAHDQSPQHGAVPLLHPAATPTPAPRVEHPVFAPPPPTPAPTPASHFERIAPQPTPAPASGGHGQPPPNRGQPAPGRGQPQPTPTPAPAKAEHGGPVKIATPTPTPQLRVPGRPK